MRMPLARSVTAPLAERVRLGAVWLYPKDQPPSPFAASIKTVSFVSSPVVSSTSARLPSSRNGLPQSNTFWCRMIGSRSARRSPEPERGWPVPRTPERKRDVPLASSSEPGRYSIPVASGQSALMVALAIVEILTADFGAEVTDVDVERGGDGGSITSERPGTGWLSKA